MRSVNCSGGLCVSAISYAPPRGGEDLISRVRVRRDRDGRLAPGWRGPGPSVLALLGLPLGDRDRRVGDLRPARPAVAIQGDVDVLQPLLVFARGEVGAELRPSGLLALD